MQIKVSQGDGDRINYVILGTDLHICGPAHNSCAFAAANQTLAPDGGECQVTRRCLRHWGGDGGGGGHSGYHIHRCHGCSCHLFENSLQTTTNLQKEKNKKNAWRCGTRVWCIDSKRENALLEDWLRSLIMRIRQHGPVYVQLALRVASTRGWFPWGYGGIGWSTWRISHVNMLKWAICLSTML